jgi:polysaccharide pyruvyl transferase WcaK-like protein
MTKILITNTNCSWNKGSAAQVISTSKILKKFITDADFTLISTCPELDSKCRKHGINIIGYHSKRKHTGYCSLYYLLRSLFLCAVWLTFRKIRINIKINERLLREYVKTDLVINLAGDSFSGGVFGVSIIIDLSIILGLILKKPVVIYSQSIGPFKGLTKPLAKFCLKRVDLITVREEITKNYLKELGIGNVHLTADCAFLLEPDRKTVKKIFESERIIKTDNPFVGISASEFMDRLNENYVVLMQKIVDYLIEKLNAQVIFVPHVTGIEGYYDDRDVNKKIYALSKNKNKIKLIKGDYTPEQLKGFIGEFDLFIGSRMHANIASTSMYVPTIAIAWSHKYYGIMKMLGQEKYVCDFEKTTFKELCSKINDALDNKEKIRKILRVKVENQKKLALLSAELVKNMWTSKQL